jgi:hypothetical protein
MTSGNFNLPDELLQAVAERTGRIALVIGAGCSMEQPTGLELSSTYAQQIHEQLLIDGVLEIGDCDDPTDLSAVASAVYTKRHSQAEVVTRLPSNRFRNAQANDGYLAAAALMREGTVSAILSLNFDLAMTHALTELSADEVSVIAGPLTTGNLGSFVVVYLHRNVNEQNPEAWILRVEALRSEWQGRWEEVLSQRVMSSPVVVFAGLGSPAAVLTECVRWIRERLNPGQHQTYVVDPMSATQFQEALDLPGEAYIQSGWCAFMLAMSGRLAAELQIALREACFTLCDAHSWNDERPHVDHLTEVFFSSGLVVSGKVRARWLMKNESYTPDNEDGRSFVADLLLGIGLAQRQSRTDINIRRDGVVEFRNDHRVTVSCLPASGAGALRWTAMEPRIVERIGRFLAHEKPSGVLISGMLGTLPASITPPEDIAYGNAEADITIGQLGLSYVTVDELRTDPVVIEQLAS